MAYERILPFVVVATFVVIVGVGTIAGQSAPDCSAVSYEGSGTSDNPYEVSNVDELQCIEEQGIDAHYHQTDDIDASATEDWNPEDEFTESTFGAFFFQEGDTYNLSRTPVDEIITSEAEVELIDSEEGTLELKENLTTFGTQANVGVDSLSSEGVQPMSEDDEFPVVNITYRSQNEFETGFEPIGAEENGVVVKEFSGEYDGDGHTVEGLSIDRVTDTGVGLFSSVEDGEVRNVLVQDAVVSGDISIGAIAGVNKGKVYGSVVSGKIEGGEEDAPLGEGPIITGGVIGENEGIVDNVSSHAAVGVGATAGGLVGENTGEVIDSEASGDVKASRFTEGGGLVGNNSGTIERSEARGDVSGGQGARAGGLVGENEGVINESTASGNVSTVGEGITVDYAGGLVGSDSGGEITNSYASGNVSGDSRVGGLVGEMGAADGGVSILSKSYASSDVDEDADEFGGIVAELGFGLQDNETEIIVEESYWEGEATGVEQAVGDDDPGLRGETEVIDVGGLDTSVMQGVSAESAMSAFDFTSTWETVPGDYPILAWETGDESGDGDSGEFTSPTDGVSDKLWTEVTGDGTLTLGDLGTAIQEYQGNGQVNGVDISLGDLGSLIQEYQG
jgi:hypothetical protein